MLDVNNIPIFASAWFAFVFVGLCALPFEWKKGVIILLLCLFYLFLISAPAYYLDRYLSK